MLARRDRLALLLLLLSAPAGRALAEAPVYHGSLHIRTTSGPIRPDGTASLTIRRWTLRLGSATDGRVSNGIHPATEPVIFAIGEQQFLIPAGLLRASRDGTRFRYLSHGRDAIRSFRLWLLPDGSYGVRFSIHGIELSVLNGDVSICRPAAVIIGDDDGFIGLELERRTLTSPRFHVAGVCDVSNEWPWIQN